MKELFASNITELDWAQNKFERITVGVFKQMPITKDIIYYICVYWRRLFTLIINKNVKN